MPTSPEPVEAAGDAGHVRSGSTETGSAEAERARAEIRERVHRGRVVTAVSVGLVAALAGVVALLGGFSDQAIRVTDVAPGETLVSGPFEITLRRATVQHQRADTVGDAEAHGLP